MTRRTNLASAALLGLVAALPAPARAQDAADTPRITGELTNETFGRFADFVEANADGNVFGLDVTVAAKEDDGLGRAGLAAYDDGSGLLVIYEAGSPDNTGTVQVSAREGVEHEGDRFVLDGLFTTEYAGMHQGITAIVLKPVPAGAAPPAMRDVAVGELPEATTDGPEEN
ncbi:hypothetical protein [Antarcticirhabdus aurantiaca]|uniref:Uncharacterized protein n=1 Tax=Antarcticirhabdus aurantiaca TaxID=2606717 RepID=A0ACD4NSY9_9HYPH|nr:hypothetical protein [Antarcticirhabdus aurantiaca]WAJ29889.1 hypothetical protein OXU80_06630 [Jeongeuplla avenae]